MTNKMCGNCRIEMAFETETKNQEFPLGRKDVIRYTQRQNSLRCPQCHYKHVVYSDGHEQFLKALDAFWDEQLRKQGATPEEVVRFRQLAGAVLHQVGKDDNTSLMFTAWLRRSKKGKPA